MPILMPTTFCPKEDGDYLLLGQDHGENLKEIARHSQARRRRVRRVQPRRHQGPPGDQAAPRHGPAGHLQRRPGGADRAGRARLALPAARQEGPPRRRPAADRLGRRLPRRLLRVGHPQGLPRLVVDHRDEGRAVLAGLRARAAVPHPRRARRRVRGVGVPQAGQRRVHPGPRPGGRVVRRRDPARVAGRARHHRERPGDRRRPRRRHRVPRPDRRLGARPAPDVPRARRPARAADRPRRARSSASASRAPRPRSTSRSTALPRYPALGDRTDQYRGFTNIGPSMEYLERAYDDAKYGWYSKRPYLDCAIQSTIDPDMAPPGKAVMSCFVQYAPYHLRESDWDTEKREPRRHRPGDARVVLPGLRRPRPPARDPDAARHRADRRPVRGQHLRRRVPRAADVLLPAGAGLVAVPDADRRLLPVRLGDASRAAASWARPGKLAAGQILKDRAQA